MPCERVATLFAADNLLRYAIKMCWIMATCPSSSFAKKFSNCNMSKALDYMKSMQPLPTIPESLAVKASIILKAKNKDQYDDHEARLFNMYVELGSCRKVAAYYSIPINHTCKVINKVKKELKCLLQS